MLKSYLGFGVVFHGAVSGLCSYSTSDGEAWLPLLIGVVGILPFASTGAKRFLDGSPMVAESLGSISDLRRDLTIQRDPLGAS